MVLTEIIPVTAVTVTAKRLSNQGLEKQELKYPGTITASSNPRLLKRIINKAAYSVMGINMAGQRDVLGIWIGENESASFWLGVCNDLKSKGVEDILITCKDGLSGFSEAINTVFPQTEIQLCVIHQIRNSLKYVPYKEQKLLMADLKKVYQALTIEEAEMAFEDFKEKWGKNTQLSSGPGKIIGLN